MVTLGKVLLILAVIGSVLSYPTVMWGFEIRLHLPKIVQQMLEPENSAKPETVTIDVTHKSLTLTNREAQLYHIFGES